MGYAQAEAQEEEDEGKVQVSQQPPTSSQGLFQGSWPQPPHGILRSRWAVFQVARLRLTSYPRLSIRREEAFKNCVPCSRGIAPTPNSCRQSTRVTSQKPLSRPLQLSPSEAVETPAQAIALWGSLCRSAARSGLACRGAN